MQQQAHQVKRLKLRLFRPLTNCYRYRIVHNLIRNAANLIEISHRYRADDAKFRTPVNLPISIKPKHHSNLDGYSDVI